MAESTSSIARDSTHVRPPFSSWLGVVLLFSLFGVLVLAVIGPSPRGTDYEKTRAKARMEKLHKTRDEDSKSLTAYAWVDKGKGTARIPIERAMELTVAQLAQQQPTGSYPIATPPPAPSGPAGPGPAATAPPAEAKGTPRVKGQQLGGQSEVPVQPAAALKPAPAAPGTQPGVNATPAASPGSPSARAPVSPAPSAPAAPAGSPLPVRGKSPNESQPQ